MIDKKGLAVHLTTFRHVTPAGQRSENLVLSWCLDSLYSCSVRARLYLRQSLPSPGSFLFAYSKAISARRRASTELNCEIATLLTNVLLCII